jgi:uncharacterized membrane protein YhaH (DUF805 family)
MGNTNPYQAPTAQVADVNQQYSDLWVYTMEGRLGRLRYLAYSFGLSIAIQLIAGVTMGLASVMPPDIGGIVTMIIMIVAYIMLLVTSLFIMVKRMHDVNRSGWMLLLLLIPLVNIILGLYMLFAPGTDGDNKYGPPPPPNSRGVVIAAFLLIGLFVLGIAAAVLIPALLAPGMQPPIQP